MGTSACFHFATDCLNNKYLVTDIKLTLVGCSEEEIRENFGELDKDGDGFVTAAELRHLDKDLTAEQVNSGKQSKMLVAMEILALSKV